LDALILIIKNIRVLNMNALNNLKDVVGSLTALAIALIAFGVAAGIVFGDVPFVGGVLDNLLGFVSVLGENGLVGLLVAGWLMSAAE
jgi:hypothetical protein